MSIPDTMKAFLALSYPERRAKLDSGHCPRCGGSAMRPADVTTFRLAGCDRLARYDPATWDGWRCSSCGAEIAIGKEGGPIVERPAWVNRGEGEHIARRLQDNLSETFLRVLEKATAESFAAGVAIVALGDWARACDARHRAESRQLRRFREAAGVTMGDLAAVLGISVVAMSDIELGRRVVDPVLHRRAVDYLENVWIGAGREPARYDAFDPLPDLEPLL